MQPLNRAGHGVQGRALPAAAQALTARCLVASSVPQRGTEDRDVAYDCSVRRSTEFIPCPCLGSKQLCKKGLLEKLGWERATEFMALGSVLG